MNNINHKIMYMNKKVKKFLPWLKC